MADRHERRRQLQVEIAGRLERVRGAMTDAEFGELLSDVVRCAERFLEIENAPNAAIAATPIDRRTIKRFADPT